MGYYDTENVNLGKPQMEWIILSAVVGSILIVWLGLPALLRAMGLHRRFVAPKRNLKGKRALIIATSHDTLGDTGKKTGVFASEMTAPYYVFLDAGMDVEVASIKGGAIPVEPMSVKWPLKSETR